MTINEKKQLSDYIKGLVRESLGEIDMPRWHNELYGVNDEDYEEGQYDDEIEDDEDFADRVSDNEDFAELRALTESIARKAVSTYINEASKKDSGKRTGEKGKEKTSSRGKTVLAKLKSPGTNAAAYFYKLFGSKTNAQKAADRSLGYKKLNGKKNSSGVPYKFTSKEINRLNSLLSNTK